MSGTDTAIAELAGTETAASSVPRSAALPYLAVSNAREAIAWYVDALGATLVGEPIVMADGRELELVGPPRPWTNPRTNTMSHVIANLVEAS